MLLLCGSTHINKLKNRLYGTLSHELNAESLAPEEQQG